jgi:hypothetical protein
VVVDVVKGWDEAGAEAAEAAEAAKEDNQAMLKKSTKNRSSNWYRSNTRHK